MKICHGTTGRFVPGIPLLCLLFFGLAPNTLRTEPSMEDLRANRDTIAREMRHELDDEFRLWYPLTLDSLYGGFFSDIDYKWEVKGIQNKFIVSQARHIWSTANAAQFFQKDNKLRKIARYGVEYLKNTMWDPEFGGFYDLVDRKGEPLKEGGQVLKKAYGNAFAIYGLAAYYRVSGDTAALHLAQKAFWWLERHSFDSQHGGYFQFMSRDGTPFTEGLNGAPPKDQNSMIHLLESLTELHKVWPDSTVRERLHSLLLLVRDVITTEKGYMVLFFKKDWTPISFRNASAEVREKNYEFDHVSFGHDVETAYLMLEASEALGMKEDTTTLKIAKKMVDHALLYGWDKYVGGIYDGGYYFAGEEKPAIIRNTKEWWEQVEALNTFLLMSELFPQDERDYYGKFRIQWEYCKKYVIDPEYGGWYWGGVDIAPNNKLTPKVSIWKCNYHTSRGLINCIVKLKNALRVQVGKRFDPVNKDASPEAKRLLESLYAINGRNIVAGHHNYVGRIDLYPNRVKELTGKLPAIWGCDFIEYYRGGNAETIVREASMKYKEGYVITLMWHAGRPQDDPPFGWKESVQAKMTDKEWQELTTPGTMLHTRWLNQVDAVAASLSKLQDLGVPVLWRPYHELNGVWFWWGNRKGQQGSAKLYRMMYDRFVHHHKLNNLIWVWNANAPRQLVNDEAYAYEDYFPGLECVDVLAADVYRRDFRQSHHDDLVDLGKGKLLALGEVGVVPAPEVLARQPMWTWFMIWGDCVDTHNTPQQIMDLYNDPRTLSHENFTTQ